MSDCFKSPTETKRDTIARLFAKAAAETDAGKAAKVLAGAMWLRLEQCLHATKCGRPCMYFVKGVGEAVAHCAANGEVVELYGSLEKPDFRCPMERF